MTRPCGQDALSCDAVTKLLRDGATGRLSLCPRRDANASSVSLSLHNTRHSPAHTQGVSPVSLPKAGVECDFIPALSLLRLSSAHASPS